MLEEKDRKGELSEIPESAFPEPSKMPEIPESADGERMKPVDSDTIPGTASKPDELPAG